MKDINEYSGHINLQQRYRASYLVAGFIRGTLRPKERIELDEWIVDDRGNMRLFRELTNQKNIENSLADFDKMEMEFAPVLRQKRIASFRVYAIATGLILFVTTVLLLIRLFRK